MQLPVPYAAVQLYCGDQLKSVFFCPDGSPPKSFSTVMVRNCHGFQPCLPAHVHQFLRLKFSIIADDGMHM